MVALAAANLVGVVLFATLYAVAGARLLPQLTFIACLAVLFLLMTTVWVRTEARHQGLQARRRAARIVLGLLVVLLITPMVFLAPLFWLAEQLPPDAGLHAARGGIMALVLIALILVVLMNVTGSLVAAGRAVLARRHAPRGP